MFSLLFFNSFNAHTYYIVDIKRRKKTSHLEQKNKLPVSLWKPNIEQYLK
jgi:hypothetical protein